jgi:uncharacterized ferritin-like protein (DUF455 family)
MSGLQGEIPGLDPGSFALCAEGERPARPRGLSTPEGVGDRLRTAAFAEWQAITAFRWAAGYFTDVSQELRDDWLAQVPDEERHYGMIMAAMDRLGVDPAGRQVSDRLWRTLSACATGKEFCLQIALEEERGRQGALRMVEALAQSDPETAAIFEQIAADEVAHVALAEKYYGWKPE